MIIAAPSLGAIMSTTFFSIHCEVLDVRERKIGAGKIDGFNRTLTGVYLPFRAGKGTACTLRKTWFQALSPDVNRISREQKRHIKLLHIKLFPVGLVTGPPGRVSGQKDLCSLGSEDGT